MFFRVCVVYWVSCGSREREREREMHSGVERLRRSFTLAERLLLLGGDGHGNSRWYSSTRSSPRKKLLSSILPLGHPSISLVPELEKWAKNQKKIFAGELQDLIKELRSRNRQKQALEVSEWMKIKRILQFNTSDHAIELDLVGKVHGLKSAESYFRNLSEDHKTQKTYGALLNCYVRENLLEESLHLMKNMKNMGFITTALPYNNIMCLYTNSGKLEKVPLVLEEMKNHGILPDNFCYRLCINSFGSRSLIPEMEKTLEEMEIQPQIVIDWNTYSLLSHIYIKSGFLERGLEVMKKLEEKMDRKNNLCYNHLISLYGRMKNKAEMWRIWNLRGERDVRYMNRDYMIMLGELVKMGELKEAEDLLKRWMESGNTDDFRVVDVVLAGFCKWGQVEKGEKVIKELERESKVKILASSWGILARAFAERGEMRKACIYLEKALKTFEPGGGWMPSSSLILRVLRWIHDDDHQHDNDHDRRGLESFVNVLKPVVDQMTEDESRGEIMRILKAFSDRVQV